MALRPRRVRSIAGSSLAELPLTLFALIFFIFVPIIDMFGLVTGVGATYLLSHEAASRASQQKRYSDALDSVQTVANVFAQSGFSRFAKMKAVGGYGGSGVDLYIDSTNFRSPQTERFGPNMPVPPPIDLTTWMYECTAVSTFEIGPAIDLSFLPVLGSVPGLGKPAVITYSASRSAEHPTGLEREAPQGNTADIPVLNLISTESNSGSPNKTDWNMPSIYDRIASSGQTVISVNVVLVAANNPNWTPTQLTVAPGEKIWLDSQAVGTWQTAGLPPRDANGVPGLVQPGSVPDPAAPFASLVGVVGKTGPIAANVPDTFFLGTNQLNFPPPGTGTLSLGFNASGNFQTNSGAQMVRVIVVR